MEHTTNAWYIRVRIARELSLMHRFMSGSSRTRIERAPLVRVRLRRTRLPNSNSESSYSRPVRLLVARIFVRCHITLSPFHPDSQPNPLCFDYTTRFYFYTDNFSFFFFYFSLLFLLLSLVLLKSYCHYVGCTFADLKIIHYFLCVSKCSKSVKKKILPLNEIDTFRDLKNSRQLYVHDCTRGMFLW